MGQLEKQTEITTFPISGKALWEEDEDKKPFYMQVAVPESRQDWPKLAEVADKWTKAEPKNTEAWFELGLAQEKMAKTELAEQAYKQAFELDSTNFDALLHLGILAKNKGDKIEMRRIHLALVNINEEVAAEYVNMIDCGKDC